MPPSCPLLDLPADVWSLVCEHFVDLKSLLSLDSALLHRASRTKFLTALSRVKITSRSFYRGIKTFDTVLFVRWVMSKDISICVLMAPDFKSRSVLPHFAKPHLLVHMHTLLLWNIEDRYFGWLEALLALCSDLKTVTVASFSALPVVSDYCANLNVLAVLGPLNGGTVPETSEKELTAVLRSCKKLRQVTIHHGEVKNESLLELVNSTVKFFVKTNQTAYNRQASLAACAVCLQKEHYFLCGDVSGNLVAKHISIAQNSVSNNDPCSIVQFRTGTPDTILRTVERFTFVFVLRIDNCTQMTAEILLKIFQLPNMCSAVLRNNTSIQQLLRGRAKQNEGLVLITFRSFTALTQSAVQGMLEQHPLADIIVENMPQVSGDGGRIKVRGV